MTEEDPSWGPLQGSARQLALEVLIHGPLSRRELAHRLDLSVPTLSRLSAPLVESGLLVEAADPPAGAIGRPARPLDIAAGAHHFVGIKLTGSSAHALVTNLRAEPLRSRERTLRGHDPRQVVADLSALVGELAAEVDGVTAVGVILGGHSADHQTVTFAPFLGWRNVPLGPALRAATGLPVVVENDLVALTGAEHWFGEGRSLRTFAVLTVGVAVGYGLFANGAVVRGPDVGIGLLGHYPLEAAGPVCPQGHRGCAESLLTQDSIRAQVSTALRRPVGYEEVLHLAGRGDPVAAAVVRDAGAALGKLIAAVANMTMPDAVFLSGEGVALAEVAAAEVAAGLRRFRHPDASPVRTVVQPYDANQWARGAAAAAIQHFALDGLPT